MEFIGANYDQENEYFESNIEYQRKAFIVVRATRDEAGSIVRVNLLFSSLFGFSKEEVLGKKINLLMPEIYSANHNDFLNRFLENSAQDQFYESKYLNVAQNFYGKNRSGYIFPMSSKVIFLKEQLSFIATFVPQSITRTNMHIIANKEGVITDISATVIHFLKLDLSQIRKSRVLINDYIPNLLQEKEKYCQNPAIIPVKIHLDNQETLCKFQCQVGQIDFCIIEDVAEDGANEEAKIQKNFGFWVKLEKVDNNNTTQVSLTQEKGRKNSNNGLSKPKMSINKLNFGFKSGDRKSVV